MGAAGHLPYVQKGPSAHGTDPELLVPPCGLEPTEVRGHLPRLGIRFSESHEFDLSFVQIPIPHHGGRAQRRSKVTMKYGMNLLLWTGGVTDAHFPLLADIKE